MRTPSIRSPDRSMDNGQTYLATSPAETPRMKRGEEGVGVSSLRRESVRNSLIMMKAKFMGDSRSVDRSHASKDEFWDGVNNPGRVVFSYTLYNGGY